MAIRIRSNYVKQRLAEIASDPTQISKWASRSLPASRLVNPVATPTDLYFVETGAANEFIKIGVSSNVATRLVKMQMDCPYRLNLLKIVPSGASLEKELHGRFSNDRVTGEWFKRSDELLAVIDAL